MNGPAGVSAHVDTFCRDNLPPPEQWPEFIWEMPGLDYPSQLNAGAELLDAAVARGWGDRPCVSDADGDTAWTYSELRDWADRFANHLVNDRGLVPGNRVLIHSFNNPWMVAAWFGVIRAGGVAVSVMPLLRSRELRTIIDKAQIRFALCDGRLRHEDELAVAGEFPLDSWGPSGAPDLAAELAGRSEPFTPVSTAADDVAMLAFTSGTTGQPKAAAHFHREILAATDTNNALLRPTSDDVFCGSPPLAFTYGLGGLLLFPLRVGASTVLTETPGPALLEAIARHRCTFCFTAPTAYRAMLDGIQNHDLSSLRQCMSAGETLPRSTWEAFHQATGIRLVDGIGSTEMLHVFISAVGDDIRPGATGRPIPGYRAEVLDENGQPAPVGEVGRLAVKGPTGCLYLDDDRQSVYVENGWNVTGDAYSKDADGYFWFHARADDMIISAGYNIAAPEVEESIMNHPAVLECAVVGVPDEARTSIVKAYVVLKEGHEADESMAREIKDHVKADIAPYKYPRAVEFLDALPRTGTGKVQRFRLRERN